MSKLFTCSHCGQYTLEHFTH